MNGIEEKLTQIKHKLSKYSNASQKDSEKVKYYLAQLKKLEKVTLECLEETGLIECVKKLKKRQDPEFSKEADEVLTRWKTLFNNNTNNTSSNCVVSNGGSIKQTTINKTTSSSGLIRPTPEALPASLPEQTTKTKPEKYHHDDHQRLSPDPESKKPRLSIQDYKGLVVKKETIENEKTTRVEQRESNSSRSKMNAGNGNAGGQLQTATATKPKSSIETEKSKATTTNLKSASFMPLPTVPLNDILSSLMPNSSASFTSPSSSSSTTSSLYNGGASDYRNGSASMRYCSGGGLSSVIGLGGGADDEDTLSSMLRSKHSKMVLYSGKRNHDGVYTPSKLFDLATRVLIENLDDLPIRIAIYNNQKHFPIAFSVIKGVMERANWKQLKNIEYYSPNLLEDTDYLWKRQSEQEFKKVDDRDDEEETWREYYFRKYDERELKFQKAREAVSRLQANKPKERQTQMATVKFVSSSASNRSSSGGCFPLKAIGPSSVINKSKPTSTSRELTESAPVRKILHDSSGIRKPITNALGPRRPTNSAPPMSQGMKATMKLIRTKRR